MSRHGTIWKPRFANPAMHFVGQNKRQLISLEGILVISGGGAFLPRMLLRFVRAPKRFVERNRAAQITKNSAAQMRRLFVFFETDRGRECLCT